MKTDIKRKLVLYKKQERCKSYSKAVEKLFKNKDTNTEPIQSKVLALFRDFRFYEKCESDSEALKLLLQRYILNGHKIPSLEELIDDYFKEYDSFTNDNYKLSLL